MNCNTQEEREALAAFVAETWVKGEQQNFRVYKNGIYSRDMTTLFKIFPPVESFEAPDGVKLIKFGAGSGLEGLRRLTLPESVDEIEAMAFENCPDLEYADIHARNIKNSAFVYCRSLKEVRLHDGLEKIGGYAFAYTGIKKLTLPPSVREIEKYILQNADLTELTLELYSKNGALPRMHELTVGTGALLTVLSAETNEKLYEFVILKRIDDMISDHGIDFTEYDELFKPNFNEQRFSIRTGLRAARVRLALLNKEDEEKRAFFEEYIDNAAFLIMMNAIIEYPENSSKNIIMEGTYLDLVTDDTLTMLVDQSAEIGKTEVTARLLQYQSERRRRG